MTIYNAIIQLLNKNKGSLILGILIMGIITVFYTGQLTSDTNDLDGVTIAILDHDDSEISRSLVNHLSTQYTRVTLTDSSQKGLDDALYFDKTEYILTIPKGFGQKLVDGQSASVESQTKPGTFSKALINSTVNHFLNTFQTFQTQLSASTSQQDIVTMAENVLNQEGTVHFDASYHQKKKQSITASIYNLLSYGLFMTIFSGYAVINLAFNRTDIANRNSCSPISRRKFSQKIMIGCLGYATACFLIFTLFVFFATGSSINQLTSYFLLNAFTFFTVMIGFSVLFSSFVKNNETISGINNVLIMGSCFISGVFIPLDILPDTVKKIASFTPTYWFVKNNALLGSTLTYNQAFKDTFIHQTLILLTFTVVFLAVHFVIIKEKNTSLFGTRKRAY